ncbi:hypothetical protein [Deinococcus planocerae]|uniref:hypothetical protein n=1 Tax=Deinococcus planocerae TaxID=1737569 RepID=UPI000C7ED300|nr:hypothetical protein [Deinococcus planocerae]
MTMRRQGLCDLHVHQPQDLSGAEQQGLRALEHDEIAGDGTARTHVRLLGAERRAGGQAAQG